MEDFDKEEYESMTEIEFQRHLSLMNEIQDNVKFQIGNDKTRIKEVQIDFKKLIQIGGG